MKRIAFGESVQGASHKRNETECQDSMKKVEFEDGSVILAVADGHGSKACPFSKSGSGIAVNVFCKVMQEFYTGYKDDLELLLTYLNREGDTKVAQAVDEEWKRRVLIAHTKNKRDVPLTSDGEKDKAEIYKEYGRYLNKVDSFEFPGLSGMDTMAGIMEGLRKNPLTDIAGHTVVKVTDYEKPEETGLPSANVLIYKLDNNETVIVRPSGTEPKIKIYYTTLGKDLAEAEAEKEKLAEALKPIMA